MFKSSTYTGAQSGTVIVACPTNRSLLIRGAVFTVANSTIVDVSMKLSLGSVQVLEHPGIPAGGGGVFNGLFLLGLTNENIIFDSSVPTTGSCSVMVMYEIV